MTHAQAPVKESSAERGLTLPGLTKPWTGDLDGMIKRPLIRILVPYSKTFYFVDRGVQRGNLAFHGYEPAKPRRAERRRFVEPA